MVRYIEKDEDSQTFYEENAKGYLSLVIGGRVNKSIPLREKIELGRDKNNTIVVSDQKVSRHHANIQAYDDETFVVTDLGSANGTYVNNLLVKQPTRLQDKDKIRLGDTLFVFMTNEPIVNNLVIPTETSFQTPPPPEPTIRADTSSSSIFQSANISMIWVALGCIAVMIVILMLVLAFLLGSLFAGGSLV